MLLLSPGEQVQSPKKYLKKIWMNHQIKSLGGETSAPLDAFREKNRFEFQFSARFHARWPFCWNRNDLMIFKACFAYLLLLRTTWVTTIPPLVLHISPQIEQTRLDGEFTQNRITWLFGSVECLWSYIPLFWILVTNMDLKFDPMSNTLREGERREGERGRYHVLVIPESRQQWWKPPESQTVRRIKHFSPL